MPSVDTSSTTISWMRILIASTRRMISSIVLRSLKTGITTESSGSGRHACRRALECRSRAAVIGRGAGAADGEERQADRRRDDAFERQRPGRDQPVEQAHLARGVLGVAADVEVVHPPEQSDRVGVPIDSVTRPAAVNAAVSERSNSAGGGRARRRAGRKCRWTAGTKISTLPLVPATTSRNSVSAWTSSCDVLEHVDADDRVEPLGLQIGPHRTPRDGTSGSRRAAGPFSSSLARRAQFALGSMQTSWSAWSGVEDLAAHRADAAADLQHVRPEMRAHQAENVTLVPDRLAHRLEVVGGVPASVSG